MKFTKPKRLSPFFQVPRIPRKLKKKVKKYCGVHYSNDANVNLWHYMEKDNIEYKWFLIREICKK